MRSSQKLQTGLIRLVPAAAMVAALFIPLVVSSADEDCPPRRCPIAPPQSREVNPSPARADGSAVEVSKAAELPPVEITVHVLAPAFVDPDPTVASFQAISVPVRYQSEGDVSCGVQALGMAMDALPGAAPTSAALLGLLEDNGMMYDFGTGVEELAYAAHSFGYTGSFAFHGATFEQLQAEVGAGSPIVVSLGANGEGEPGHFITVTGISSDGQYVAYNDPTLGKQVISTTEFERLWGLQGNSGVVVAAEPPPASGVDPGVLSLWVAFAAGVMALVSTTPLAKLRRGIGGMLDAGPSSYPLSKPVAKPAAKAVPREKEKKAKKAKARFDEEIVAPPVKAKVTKARFDEEISMPSTPVSKVVVTPTELRAAQEPPPPTPVPSQARFGEEDEDKGRKSSGNGGKARFDYEIAPGAYDFIELTPSSPQGEELPSVPDQGDCDQPGHLIVLPGVWQPAPCQTLNPIGKALIIGFGAVAIAETLALGSEVLSAGLFGIPVAVLCFAVGAWLTANWWNVAQTPTEP